MYKWHVVQRGKPSLLPLVRLPPCTPGSCSSELSVMPFIVTIMRLPRPPDGAMGCWAPHKGSAAAVTKSAQHIACLQAWKCLLMGGSRPQ